MPYRLSSILAALPVLCADYSVSPLLGVVRPPHVLANQNLLLHYSSLLVTPYKLTNLAPFCEAAIFKVPASDWG